MHPLFVQLRGPLRYEAESWLAGDELSELIELGNFLGALKFAFTAERAIEGAHAQVIELKPIERPAMGSQ